MTPMTATGLVLLAITAWALLALAGALLIGATIRIADQHEAR